jgi:hypothetical protein
MGFLASSFILSHFLSRENPGMRVILIVPLSGLSLVEMTFGEELIYPPNFNFLLPTTLNPAVDYSNLY